MPNASDEENKTNFEIHYQNLLSFLKLQTGTSYIHNELIRTKSFLGALLNLHWPDTLYEQLDAKGRYQNTLIAITMLIQGECQRHPLVLELEDGHWFDKASQEMITIISQELKDLPILMIITSRYKDNGSRPEFKIEKNIPTLHLEFKTPASYSRTRASTNDFRRGHIIPITSRFNYQNRSESFFYSTNFILFARKQLAKNRDLISATSLDLN